MKLKISAVLLKEEVRIADAISNKPDIRSVRFQIDEHTAHLFWRKSQSQPKWIDLFEAVDGINVADFKSENPQAVLALLVEERVICFTFGHARHLIESIKIEKYFGLKVALNISDPELLKSIDKSSIDKVPFQSRSQSSRYVSINEFEFKFDWEILKSITGVVESAERRVRPYILHGCS
ncbi:TIGR04141 family sporadically distributed protein [Permianibacter aggregans]|uniref:Uncharacterized protein (TIGR04141 family) n=1 Tax=Permianibacter aggregans TaxID=1510150 RepID=A0A4R6URJ5_9GAMM|nr:TIGR04141 family sporadically distributed protein [Permianibacter aggregans]QGX39831.1 hypothetical protein E2H98_09240 [Permianibacter aggregans]TDQ45924.1 uncharacterized protein (TIGR04141 family) [Permianibacter aggregans]